jgi:hypothetical protein
MRNCKPILGFACVLAGCFGDRSSEYVPPPEAYHSPRSISEILKSARPQDFYTEAYGAFRFSSQSVVSVPKTSPPKTFQGSSALEMDDKGNYHLIRIPLSGEPAVEVIAFDKKVYLKSGTETGFRVLRPQAEIARWLTVSLREIFALYAQSDLVSDETATTKGNLSCWAKERDVLCMDPVTALPIEGTLSAPQPSGSVLTVRFNVAPAKPETLRLAPPS